MVEIYTGDHIIQLVLDEPPEDAENKWAKERIELYKRLEPSEPPLDEAPINFDKDGRPVDRIIYNGEHSDRIWRILYTNANAEELRHLGEITKAAMDMSETEKARIVQNEEAKIAQGLMSLTIGTGGGTLQPDNVKGKIARF